MRNSILTLVVQAVSVGLIVVASRWLFAAKGTDTPRVRGNIRIYTIKSQWRIVGMASAILCGALTIQSLRDFSSRAGWVSVILLSALSLSGLWISIGTVTTDESTITKSTLGYSRSLRWEELTEIRSHSKHGGAIEIRTGSKKIVVDSRFNATKFLLEEIVGKSHLQPVVD